MRRLLKPTHHIIISSICAKRSAVNVSILIALTVYPTVWILKVKAGPKIIQSIEEDIGKNRPKIGRASTTLSRAKQGVIVGWAVLC